MMIFDLLKLFLLSLDIYFVRYDGFYDGSGCHGPDTVIG